MSQLRAKLEQYDFPVLLAAEWGHPDRLLKLLDASDTPQVRKIKIISLLGEMQADEALPQLKAALKDKNLSKEAAVALGSMGKDGIPILVDILKHSRQPELQAAAAKGLGDLGNIHNDSSVVPPLLEMLDAPGVDIAVQTEVAWALGRVPDRRSVKPLFDLDKKLQKNPEGPARPPDQETQGSGVLVHQTSLYGRPIQLDAQTRSAPASFFSPRCALLLLFADPKVCVSVRATTLETRT